MAATRFNIAKSTLQDRHQGTHVPCAQKCPHKLSIAQDNTVIASSNVYTD